MTTNRFLSEAIDPNCHNATAFVRIAEAFTLRAGIFNLTNRKYIEWSDVRGLDASAATTVDAYTQPGRNVSVSLTARF